MFGIFGGSGFYQFLENFKEADIDTPFGKPSDKIVIGEYLGKRLAFLPRHGRNHNLPPHKIPYRANLWAMKELGVMKIIAPCAAGSLQPHIKPGDFVIPDSYSDKTCGRESTFYNGPEVRHISSIEPYCQTLRKLAKDSFDELKFQDSQCHFGGTVVVIQGPRFSTKAESRFLSRQGFEVINMTQYPEVVLANELGICYANISLITDYDAGLEGIEGIKASSAQEILATFKKNNERVRQLIFKMIEKISMESCKSCLDKVEQSKFS